MNFDPNIPIYLQIMDEFKKNIINGEYAPSSKVKPVRELALEFGVNPNTVQRALSELERINLLRSERTSGRFISDDESLIANLRKDAASQKVDGFVKEMYDAGFKGNEIVSMIQNAVN